MQVARLVTGIFICCAVFPVLNGTFLIYLLGLVVYNAFQISYFLIDPPSYSLIHYQKWGSCSLLSSLLPFTPPFNPHVFSAPRVWCMFINLFLIFCVCVVSFCVCMCVRVIGNKSQDLVVISILPMSYILNTSNLSMTYLCL